MNAVISLTCSRGLSAAVPVSGSYAERLSAMLRAPVLNGSKIGSPGNTMMGRRSRGAASGVKLMS